MFGKHITVVIFVIDFCIYGMLHKTFLTLNMSKIERVRLGLTTDVAPGYALGLNQCLTCGEVDVHRLASLFGNRTS